MKLTDDLRGKFLNVGDDGMVTELPEPADDAAFPICAGRWPNRHVGARQAICDRCGGFCGIAPKGYALHLANPPLRPILCPQCFWTLVLFKQIGAGSAGGDAGGGG